MSVSVDRVIFATPTTGTGAIADGPEFKLRYRNLSTAESDGDLNAGDQVGYFIEDGDNWEVGVGTYTSSVITRDTIVRTSNGDTSPLNLSGDAVVFLDEVSAVINAKLSNVEDDTNPHLGGTLVTEGHNIQVSSSRVDEDLNPLAVTHEGVLARVASWLSGAPAYFAALLGSTKSNPQSATDIDAPLVIGGSYVILAGSLLMDLPGAEVGSTLVVSAVHPDDPNLGLITHVPPVPPANSASSLFIMDVAIPATDTWTPIGPIISPMVNDYGPPDDLFGFVVKLDNTASQRTVSVEVGFELAPDAGDPVWAPPLTSFSDTMLPGTTSMMTYSDVPLPAEMPAASAVQMVAKATAIDADIEIGVWDFAAASIGIVLDGEFRTNTNKPTSTATFRFDYTDADNRDRSALLAALEVGSTFTASRADLITTYTIDSVTDDSGNGRVDVTVSDQTGNNTNWSGTATFTGRVTAAAVALTTRGTEFPTSMTVKEPATSVGGTDIKDVKATAVDPTAGFLFDKLKTHIGGGLTVFNPGGDEELRLPNPSPVFRAMVQPASNDTLTVVNNEVVEYTTAGANTVTITTSDPGVSRALAGSVVLDNSAGSNVTVSAPNGGTVVWPSTGMPAIGTWTGEIGLMTTTSSDGLTTKLYANPVKH